MNEREERAGEGTDGEAEVPWGEMGRGVPAGLGSGDLGEAADAPDDAVAGDEEPPDRGGDAA